MFRTIFAFIGALLGYVWSFVSGPATRIIIPILLGGLFIFCIIFGISFVVVYKEIFLVLIVLISLGIWIPVIRPARNFLLAVWAIWFVIEVVFIGIVYPKIDNLLNNNPAYAELKQTIKNFSVNRTEESIVSMKKEMMNSESVKGTFGEMKEDSPAYDENGNIIPDLFLKKGQKIMSLGTESKKQDDGSEGMAYVIVSNEHGHFVKGVKALIPIRIIEWESNKERIKNQSSANASWEKVEEKVVDFSQLEATPIAQGRVVGEIPLSLKKLEAGNYRVSLSGNWSFFMSSNAWVEFPWQGNNRLAGRPEFRPEQRMSFGAIILLNNGENITPVDEKGLGVSLSESSNISIRINVLLGNEEFYSPKIGKPVFKNSTVSPLTITIEKEVEK